MTRGGKKFIKPGSLAKQKKTGYEMARDMRIEENNVIMNSLGIKGILGSLKDSLHPKLRNEKGKGIRSDTENNESTDGDDNNDNDDDSFDSFQNELTYTPPFRIVRSSLNLLADETLLPHMALQSSLESHPPQVGEMAHQSSLEHHAHQSSLAPQLQLRNEATTRSNVGKRGATRGLLAQRLIDKEGKLDVPIPHEFRAPVGIHASKLASKIGFEVRSNVQDLSVRHWKAVDDSVKSPLLQRIQDQFNITGDPNDVNKSIATSCGRRLSDHTYKLHKKFKKLKDTKGEGYARRNPPKEASMEQWMNLIDKKWTNPIWKDRSRNNTENRCWLKSKNRCGSKSIPVRVHEYTVKHEGQVQNFPEFYKETHFNVDTRQWIDSECEANYDKMVQIEVE